MALELKYFVLKPTSSDPRHACASRQALLAYADSIREYDPTLADDLQEWERRAYMQSMYKMQEQKGD